MKNTFRIMKKIAFGSAFLAIMAACTPDPFLELGRAKGWGTEGSAGEIIQIRVAVPPARTEYAIGESFDPAGMLIKARYRDDIESDLSPDKYTIDPNSTLFDKLGKAAVIIRYESAVSKLQTSTDVTVIDPDSISTALTGILIYPLPKKWVYEAGEPLDLAGMGVMEIYTDSADNSITQVPVSEDKYTVTTRPSPQEMLTEGWKDIEVTHNESLFTAVTQIQVIPAVVKIP